MHNIHTELPISLVEPLSIVRNQDLSQKTWFKTGGVANYFCRPTTAAQFAYAVRYAGEHALPIFVLGAGANVLISDAGFAGLVIQPQLNEIVQVERTQDQVLVRAGAGVHMSNLIEYCLAHNIVGLEEFSGIPGTVGGSVYINLHYFQFLLEHFLVEAQVINAATGIVEVVSKSWFAFGYDQSVLQDSHYYVVSATFALKPCTDLAREYARGRRVEIIRHRTSRYPAANTCGSFFRNFYDSEVTLVSNGKKMIYAAYYLDKIGAKGTLRVGGALVSYQHANMLVNDGSATSTDIITLARTLQQLVRDQFGIIPQPECVLVGFDEYPLL